MKNDFLYGLNSDHSTVNLEVKILKKKAVQESVDLVFLYYMTQPVPIRSMISF